ncbi:hypothetical protein GBA52_026951 [Prunus armeniaca]|nr:hypothetical protein GBA52_026951 [Prunus armeniaca]
MMSLLSFFFVFFTFTNLYNSQQPTTERLPPAPTSPQATFLFPFTSPLLQHLLDLLTPRSRPRYQNPRRFQRLHRLWPVLF